MKSMMVKMIESVIEDKASATWESGAPFWVRQMVDRFRKLVFEKLPDRADQFPEYFDNINGPLALKYREPFYQNGSQMLKFKGYTKKLSPEEKVGVCVHQTAIEFGTSSYRRKFWRKIIDVDASTVIQHGFVIPEDEEGKSKLAERIALHERFWKVPYHFVGLKNGDVLYNNEVTSYTWHGNLANKSTLGVAIEGHFPGLEKNRAPKHTVADQFFLDTMHACLRLSVLKSRELGCPIGDCTAHRVYSSSRVGDPGELIWKEVVIPAIERYNLKVDYDRVVKSGRQIPREWDASSPYNWYGKRIG
jgi:hypothetical protein